MRVFRMIPEWLIVVGAIGLCVMVMVWVLGGCFN